MKSIMLSMIFLLWSLTDVWTLPEPKCECPPENNQCHELYWIDNPCYCQICLTKCYEREEICGINRTCILAPFIFKGRDLGMTAKCVEFTGCQKVTCATNCPKSGFYYDINGCQTCLCNDPCGEQCPSGKCSSWSINPGIEPTYECQDDKKKN